MVIGYTSGVFDMFHIGHLNILQRAKERCDKLIVGVSTDDLVMEYKNKLPIIPYDQRAAIVQAIRYVDEVIPQYTMDKMKIWEKVRFEIMFHGNEWKGTDLYDRYEKEFAKIGVRIEYFPHTDGISSSDLRVRITK